MSAGGKTALKPMIKASGYTIVEVMIFLVVSGILLISAMTLFNGQQRRTQFTNSVRETDARIRTIINEVGSGYYPSNGFKCTVDGSGEILLETGSEEQGTNKDCIFLGKILSFSKDSSDYSVYTVVGKTKNGDELTTSLSDSNPTIIAQDEAEEGPDNTENFTMSYGLSVDNIKTLQNSQNIGSFGILQSLGVSNSGGSDPKSASQTVDTIPLAGSNLGSSPSEIKNRLSLLDDTARNSSSIRLCLKSGGGDRYASITIGGSNGGLGTEVKIDDKDCEPTT